MWNVALHKNYIGKEIGQVSIQEIEMYTEKMNWATQEWAGYFISAMSNWQVIYKYLRSDTSNWENEMGNWGMITSTEKWCMGTSDKW